MNPGDVFGHYRIVEPLGKGGMGEVFVAEDTRLHRRVALKVLPPMVAADPAQRERFEREARAVAALNHPNIVTIHSVEELDGRMFLTMELVDGKPLGEIIPRGGLPLDRILRIGIEVADAMAAAQQQGITHRDLKPANIVIASSGRAKVLDFGLAKLRDAEAVPADDLTRMSPGGGDLTGEGKIVGTVAYMSPEQAEGKPVDPRSDIFSLGVVLHEMSTGEKPFKGDTNVSVISSIIKDVPPLITDSNPSLPGDLARIVRRCLAKDPERRYQTAADLRNELEDLKQDAASGTIVMPRPVVRGRMPWAGIIAGVGVVGVLAATFSLVRHDGAGAKPPETFTIDRLARLTATGTASKAAISPDGRYVVHVKVEPGLGPGLWTRQTATTSDVRIVPPADVQLDGLAFSPDGNYIYYSYYPALAGTASLFRVPLLGGTPAKIVDDIDSPVTFSPDQTQFAFLRGSMKRNTTELVIADAGGRAERVVAAATPPDRFQSEGLAWSPDGGTILVVTGSTRPGFPAFLYSVDVKSGTAKSIGEPWGFLRDVQWMPDGRSYLLTAIDLSGQNNLQIWRVTYPGNERSRVTNDLNAYVGASLSADGKSLVTVQAETISAVYVAEGPDKEPRMISGGPGRADGNNGIAWLPDGRLVYTSTATGLSQLWIADANGGNAHQLTSTTGPSFTPCSTRDGKWIWFTTFSRDGGALFRIAPDGSGLEQMTKGGDARNPIAAPDGRTIYFTSAQTGLPRLMKVPAEGGKAEVVSPAFFRANDISPDGTHLIGSGWSEERRRAVVETMSLADAALTEVQGITSVGFFLPDGGLAVPQRIQGKSIIMVRPEKEKAFRPVTPPNPEAMMAGAVSRDGRIAFARGSQISDVVLIKAK
jgi:Tol biopolymer transport system component/predicted Ser/Thr protein kinase